MLKPKVFPCSKVVVDQIQAEHVAFYSYVKNMFTSINVQESVEGPPYQINIHTAFYCCAAGANGAVESIW